MSANKSVKKDGLKITQAAKDYSVPRKTLSDYLKQTILDNGEVICSRKQLGQQTSVLSKEQEKILADRLLLLSTPGK